MTIPIPTGVFDILPSDPKELWRNSHLWQFVESVIRQHAESFACSEIRTPIFERTELFSRSVGDETDIVAKEMYTFPDKGGRMLSLRPEGTASVMRAFIEKQLHMLGGPQRFYYIGPMFRYERPQSGRFRQHHQFGVEIIGNAQPESDAELIELLYSFYQRLGMQHLTVHLNSLGDKVARANFRNALQEYLRPHIAKLSEDSQRRFTLNPLRILDSKDEADKEAVKNAPCILDFLSPECKVHFEKVQALLKALKIPYDVNPLLVRGLDYYNRTVFEITTTALGAQNTVGGGGRYDGLLKSLGGPDLPSIGFGTGIERIIQTLLHQKHEFRNPPKPQLYIIPLGESAIVQCFELAQKLRGRGVVCYLETSGKKLKNAMQQADSMGAEFTLVLGDNEIAKGECEIKEMQTGQKLNVTIDGVCPFFSLRSKGAKFKQYSDEIQQEILTLEKATSQSLSNLGTSSPIKTIVESSIDLQNKIDA